MYKNYLKKAQKGNSVNNYFTYYSDIVKRDTGKNLTDEQKAAIEVFSLKGSKNEADRQYGDYLYNEFFGGDYRKFRNVFDKIAPNFGVDVSKLGTANTAGGWKGKTQAEAEGFYQRFQEDVKCEGGNCVNPYGIIRRGSKQISPEEFFGEDLLKEYGFYGDDYKAILKDTPELLEKLPPSFKKEYERLVKKHQQNPSKENITNANAFLERAIKKGMDFMVAEKKKRMQEQNPKNYLLPSELISFKQKGSKLPNKKEYTLGDFDEEDQKYILENRDMLDETMIDSEGNIVNQRRFVMPLTKKEKLVMFKEKGKKPMDNDTFGNKELFRQRGGMVEGMPHEMGGVMAGGEGVEPVEVEGGELILPVDVSQMIDDAAQAFMQADAEEQMSLAAEIGRIVLETRIQQMQEEGQGDEEMDKEMQAEEMPMAMKGKKTKKRNIEERLAMLNEF